MTDLIKRDDALAAIDTFKRDFEQSWKVQFSAAIKALPAVTVETCWKCGGSGMAIGDGGDPCICNECKYDGVVPVVVDPATAKQVTLSEAEAIREAALQARIKELENSLAWYQMMDAMSSDHVVELTDKLEAAEAMLTKAVETLRFYSRLPKNPTDDPWGCQSEDWGNHANAVLAELEKTE